MTQTAIPSGLGETFGVADETTVGTFAAPARFIPHDKAEFHLKKKTVQDKALRGSRFELASRRVLVSKMVTGTIDLTPADKQFGIVLARCLGSTAAPVQLGATTLYAQYHTPGFLEGHALSFQKGVPTIAGTIQSFSYAGCKITDWTLSVSRDQLAKLSLNVDGWTEDTGQTYTAPSYLAGSSTPSVLSFAGGALLTGGTASTSAGVTTVSGNAAPVGIVSAVTLKGVNKFNVDRIPFGSTTKQEQLTNDFTAITGDMTVEFANLTDFYNAFSGDTSSVLTFNLLGGTVQSSYQSGIYATLPAVKFEGDTPNASGVGTIEVKVPFTALDDGSGTNPVIQLAYISTDTAS